MDNQEILDIIRGYGIDGFSEKNEIDSTHGDDFRLNIIIDKKYVLRINNAVMTEERLDSIDRLAERYRSIGVLTPRLLKNKSGNYLTTHADHVCYVSEYMDFALLAENEEETDEEPNDETNKETNEEINEALNDENVEETIRKEVLQSIGRFSKLFSNVDLSEVMSMWSIIDLAPLDVDIDEKQENLNLLIKYLNENGELELAQEIEQFNDTVRERIKSVYKELPRCVIQGDLNPANILIKDGHFIGLVDFNLAGTEVNVNHFCCETNEEIHEEDFAEKEADVIYEEWIKEQQTMLDVILSEYPLNDMEKTAINDYRRICRISMFPNVMSFIEYLKRDKEKMKTILRRIISE